MSFNFTNFLSLCEQKRESPFWTFFHGFVKIFRENGRIFKISKLFLTHHETSFPMQFQFFNSVERQKKLDTAHVLGKISVKMKKLVKLFSSKISGKITGSRGILNFAFILKNEKVIATQS